MEAFINLHDKQACILSIKIIDVYAVLIFTKNKDKCQ